MGVRAGMDKNSPYEIVIDFSWQEYYCINNSLLENTVGF